MAESGKGSLHDSHGIFLHFVYTGIVGDESEAKLFVGETAVVCVKWDSRIVPEQNIVAFLTAMSGQCDQSLERSVVVIRPPHPSDIPGFRVQ